MEAAWGTTEGTIDIWLRDDLPWDAFTPTVTHSAANPVENFLNYVIAGSYDNTFFHRYYESGPNSIIQAGGYIWDTTNQVDLTIVTDLPIHYQSKMPNTRGTIAMARTSDPNSATSGWFINVTDNTTLWADQPSCNPALSFNTGCGYTAFGEVLNGMDLVEQISALPRTDCGGSFQSLPLYNYLGCEPLTQNLALIKSARIIAVASSSVRPVMGDSGNYTIMGPESPAVATKFESAANPSPDDAPADVTFNEGFFDIELTSTEDTSYVVLTLPEGQQPNTYYKYGPTPDDPTNHWYEFMWDGKTGAIMGFGSNSNMVALVFIDGERGDDDLAINGVIVDVGAPGVKPVSSSGGSGGGGAFDAWSLLALLGLSGFFPRNVVSTDSTHQLGQTGALFCAPVILLVPYLSKFRSSKRMLSPGRIPM